MDTGLNTLSAWSYGLAGFVFAAFAIFHASGWKTGLRSRTLFFAVVLSAIWGVSGLLLSLGGQPVFTWINLFADLLRYGGWFAFLLVLILPENSASPGSLLRWRWFASVAVALLAIGIVARTMAIEDAGLPLSPQKISLLDALGMSVFSLVLLEQLWRSVGTELRWSIKPL